MNNCGAQLKKENEKSATTAAMVVDLLSAATAPLVESGRA